uniref:Uncharacterized protein n=1 Tax=Romanomermis culicivorax TaxID=13658 RepID=A0A915HML3_ROMCU
MQECTNYYLSSYCATGPCLVPLDKSFKYRNRCLCPLPTKICSCSHAQWSGIEIKDGHLKFTNPCVYGLDSDRQSCQNRTIIDENLVESPRAVDVWVKSSWVVLVMLLAAAFMITVSACCLRIAYKKYTRSEL